MNEDLENESENESENAVQDELSLLKERAKLMGIKYHHSAGINKLKELIDAKLNGSDVSNSTKESDIVSVQKSNKEKASAKRMRLRKESNMLLRLRITCMNPNKRDWPGEIISVSNKQIGTIKKFIPFNAESYHVPSIIVNVLKERECQVFIEKIVNGQKIKVGKLIKEFSIEVLPPLTKKELKDLANQQSARHSID